MQVQAQTFTNTADMMASYAAVRSRLFTGRPRPRVDPVALPEPDRPEKARAVGKGHPFNAHVIAYRVHMLRAEWNADLNAGEVPAEMLKRPRFRHSYTLIERRICRATGISRHEIRSDHRARKTVLARQAIAYWCYRLTPMSLPQIGRMIGGRDHTTMIHAVTVYPRKRAEAGRHLREVRGAAHIAAQAKEAA